LAHWLSLHRENNRIQRTVNRLTDIIDRNDLNLPFIYFVKNLQQVILIHGFILYPVNDMIQPAPFVEKAFGHYLVTQLRELQRGDAIPPVMNKSLDCRTIGIGQEPFQ
jgi:hypothetical protein